MQNFIKEFRAFISRGNVLDLAVAVIVGGAFSGIVNSLVKDIINPILGAVAGKPDFTDFFIVFSLPEGYAGPETYKALTEAGASVFGYGAFLTTVINFIILALVIFWMIRVVTSARKKLEAALAEEKKAEAAKPAAPAPTPEDIVLLREIRDLLKK